MDMWNNWRIFHSATTTTIKTLSMTITSGYHTNILISIYIFLISRRGRTNLIAGPVLSLEIERAEMSEIFIVPSRDFVCGNKNIFWPKKRRIFQGRRINGKKTLKWNLSNRCRDMDYLMHNFPLFFSIRISLAAKCNTSSTYITV